ncbi:MAG: divalent-cation tolerance protein CutA [Kofleriaceae bacterium]|nr:divalent-cation tolerance protein CutA [Kofleriaceae bacterium]
MATDVLVVLCTLPAGDAAADIARAVVEERLAACVNLVPGVRSIYSWEGQLQDDAEQLAILKTTIDRFEELRARLLALHPASVPEILALPVQDGHLAYLGWVRDAVRAP